MHLLAILRRWSSFLPIDGKKVVEDTHDTASVVDGAKDTARDASVLMKNIKKAAEKENDAATRRKLIQAAEQCAASTQAIAVAAKAVARYEPQADKKLIDAAAGLQAQLRGVFAYNRTNGPNFRPLLDAARQIAEETSKMLEVLKVVTGKPKDAAAQTQLTLAAKSTTDAIKQLMQAAEGLTYGLKECKEAIEVIQRAIGDLDAAAISATVGLLEASVGGPTNQQCKEELIALSRDLAATTGKLVTSAKSEPEHLGPAAQEASIVVPKIVESSKRLAATTTDSETQQAQLQLAKNMVDSMLSLVQSARATSSNPQDQETLNNLATSARSVSSAITELVSSLKGGVLGLRACDEAMQAIESQLGNLGKPATGPKKTYAQASDDVTKQTKELVNGVARMAETAKSNPERIGDVSKMVADVIPALVIATNAAAAASTEEEVRKKLVAAAKNVVSSAKDAISAGKNVAADPKNGNAILQMSQQQRTTTQAIGNLLNTLKEGATLERDGDYAIAKIQATMAELDAASLFAAATAGQLDSPNVSTAANDHSGHR
jgi:hypothetical protein